MIDDVVEHNSNYRTNLTNINHPSGLIYELKNCWKITFAGFWDNRQKPPPQVRHVGEKVRGYNQVQKL